jgi:hypothetical protein
MPTESSPSAAREHSGFASSCLYYRKRRLDDFDAVIPRIGASVTF